MIAGVFITLEKEDWKDSMREAAADLTVTQVRGNKIYTYDPNTSKITEACFSTLEVDCTNCTSSECPVPDLGGTDLNNGVEPDAEGTPAGCGSFLLETEKPVIVYNYVNVYGAEHYWYRYRNEKTKLSKMTITIGNMGIASPPKTGKATVN